MADYSKKVSLFLMTYKGFETLTAIVNSEFKELIGYVVIGEDKNTLNDYSKELTRLCLDHGIEFYSRNDILPFSTEYILTVSWRWLIKNTSSKLIIFHESLLPKYRGFAPLVNQLINKEDYIGVTAILGEEEYDTGEIIGQEKLKISYPIKINDAIINVSQLYGTLVLKILSEISEEGQIKVVQKQNVADITYSLWRDDEDYRIDWTKSSDYVCRFIDSVGFPYRGSFTSMEGKLIRISCASTVEDVKIEIRDIGKVIFFKDGKPVVVCGKGLVKIDEATFEDSNKTIFPLRKFRLRFK